MSKRRLGKGIDALLQGRDLEQLTNMASVLIVDVERVEPSPGQPRTRFNDASLAELAASIREKGIIQPIIAEDRGDGSYTIVAGERRYRAARIAGLTEVPLIPVEFTEEEKLEVALVENLHREDLNPLDEAMAFDTAMRNAGYTQEQLAARLGKSRSAIANALRLLKLESDIQEAIAAGEISAGHARALLAVDNPTHRRELYERIRSEGLSVRQAEAARKPVETRHNEPSGAGETATIGTETEASEFSIGSTEVSLEIPSTAPSAKSPELQHVEDELVRALGTRVIVRGTDEKGRIEIPYRTMDDLNRLLELLGVIPE